MSRAVRALGVTTILVLLSEGVHYVASRRLSRVTDSPGATTAVIVLGYGVPRSRLHGAVPRLRAQMTTVQRWRVEVAVRTLAAAGSGCVIFSGSDDGGGVEGSEAKAMAAYAISRLGLDPECVRLEPLATHTWDNVRHSLHHAEAYDRIAIASDPLHAARAARYAARQRPDLRGRLCAADTYRLFERWWLKAPTVPYEGWRWLRDRGLAHQEEVARSSRSGAGLPAPGV